MSSILGKGSLLIWANLGNHFSVRILGHSHTSLVYRLLKLLTLCIYANIIKYVRDLLRRANLVDCKQVSTLMVVGISLSMNDGKLMITQHITVVWLGRFNIVR